MIITCAPFPHWLHTVVFVVVVVVISCCPPARRTLLNSVKNSRHCTETSFSVCYVFIPFSLFFSVCGRSVLQQVCYSPPCYGAGGCLRGGLVWAWTPTDCRTPAAAAAAAAAGEGALGHSRQLDTDGAPKRATSPPLKYFFGQNAPLLFPPPKSHFEKSP